MAPVTREQFEAVWSELTPDERRLILALPWYGTVAVAARSMGKSPRWAESALRRHPAFRLAVDTRWPPGWVAQAIGEDLMPLALGALSELVDVGRATVRTGRPGRPAGGAIAFQAAKVLIQLNGGLPMRRRRA